MEKMLHQLESFSARGSDGNTYRVRGYEHLARLEAVRGARKANGSRPAKRNTSSRTAAASSSIKTAR